jgi:hypothetical protein
MADHNIWAKFQRAQAVSIAHEELKFHTNHEL